MFSASTSPGTAPDLFHDGNPLVLGSSAIKKAPAPVTFGQTPLGGSPGSRSSLSVEETARFAQEWPTAVSLGWDEVVHLLESCCPDAKTQQMLRTLASD